MYEKLISHKLSNFCKKCFFFGLLLSLLTGMVWAMLMHCASISHHLQKYLASGMEPYIAQLDFNAVFDRVSYSGLLFKLKSIGVGGSVLSIWREFLFNHRQRVVVDGATSEWIPRVFGVPNGSVLGSLLFILYTCEVFELVENRLYAYADDSTQLAVVRKPADRPAVATSLNKDFAIGFKSGAITGAWYWNLTKLRL